MTAIQMKAVKKSFGAIEAVRNIDIDISDGEFVTLVGPSGCGKSTTLRLIAGLEEVDEGRIVFGDREVTNLPARDRNVGFVFQNLAIYPHMSVRENMEFGLNIAGIDEEEQESRIHEKAQMLGITDLLDRDPSNLSGGQKQRVAIGRTLVLEPDVFLLDEPLSNLDAKLRTQIRTDLLQLHNEIGITTIYVTHDQRQAMTMSDRVIVLRNGEIQQSGSPEEIYQHPANAFVGHFMGTPSMNQYPYTLNNDLDKPLLDLEFAQISTDKIPSDQLSRSKGQLGIRPEDIELKDRNGILAEAILIESTGSSKIVHFECDEQQITGLFDESIEIEMGEEYNIKFPQNKIHLFDEGF